MFAFDPGQHSGDVAVFPIERKSTLCVIPSKARKTSVDREMLHDRCPVCSGVLRISFRLRNGVLRPFCRKCTSLLTTRGGEAAGLPGAEFAAGVLDIQRQAGRIVRGNGECRVRLEHAIRTLWAPLDRLGAARPVLALWFDQPGWHCPFEARAAVGTSAPLQYLPVRWRALTLVTLQDLFGSGLVFTTAIPEVAHDMFRWAVPVRPRHQAGIRDRQRKEPC